MSIERLKALVIEKKGTLTIKKRKEGNMTNRRKTLFLTKQLEDDRITVLLRKWSIEQRSVRQEGRT